MRRFLESLGLTVFPDRSRKPRKLGFTMCVDGIGDSVNSVTVLAAKEYIDRVKVVDCILWIDDQIARENIRKYVELGIEVQMGGVAYEIATLHGLQDEYLEGLKDVGVSVVEVENHSGAFSFDQMRRDIDRFTRRGFKVVGEVGTKWPHNDPTRIGRDRVDVDKVVKAMSELLETGAEHVYWEGQVVRCLIGTTLENVVGQQQLREVALAIGPDNIVFEVFYAKFGLVQPFVAWLVKEFGPNVNLGNVPPLEVLRAESVRNGTWHEMDHPYLRWLKEGKPVPEWWKMESPDYDVDVQRGYVLKDYV